MLLAKPTHILTGEHNCYRALKNDMSIPYFTFPQGVLVKRQQGQITQKTEKNHGKLS